MIRYSSSLYGERSKSFKKTRIPKKNFRNFADLKFDYKTKLKKMSKTMTVDILSSIKGAQPSESVNKLFDVIKNAVPSTNNTLNNVNRNCVSVNDLREDVVVESSAIEKQLILENFPNKKNGFLVVAKVIEG
jgi:Asp-tRNA(Asn)/Glu-tRNA(Gln) amidotransferase C subunit